MKILSISILLLCPGFVVAQTWIPQTSGTSNLLHGVWFTTTLNGWAVGDGGTSLVTTNGGLTWAAVGITSGDLSDVAFLNASTGVIVGDDGLILRTITGGVSWSVATSGTASNLRSVSFGEGGKAYIGGREGTILLSTDSGSSWSIAETSAVRYRGSSARGTNHAWIVGEGGAIRATTNGGVSWFSQSAGTSSDLHCVFFVNDTDGWIGGQNSTLLYTSNGGTQWSSRNSGIITSVDAVHFLNADVGTAVGDGGNIYRTTNGGVSWTQEPSGTSNELNDVFFLDEAHAWTVGGGGIILFRNPPTSVDDTKHLFPKRHVLEQNYPNPFNPSTTIQYAIAREGVVSLSIFSIIGQLVLVPLRERQLPGHHSIQIDASALPSGVYVYRLDIDGKVVASRRMILAR